MLGDNGNVILIGTVGRLIVHGTAVDLITTTDVLETTGARSLASYLRTTFDPANPIGVAATDGDPTARREIPLHHYQPIAVVSRYQRLLECAI